MIKMTKDEIARLKMIELELKLLIRFCEMNNDTPTLYALHKILGY